MKSLLKRLEAIESNKVDEVLFGQFERTIDQRVKEVRNKIEDIGN
jgi:hypothetical protein